MKKILILIIALGAVISCASCTRVIYQPDPTRPMKVITGTNTVYYENRADTPAGTVYSYYPKGLNWLDMSITWQSYVVTVKASDGRVIDVFDLRLSGQKVDKFYYPTGVNGQKLKVNIFITGGAGSTNFIIVKDGNSRHDRTYSLPSPRTRYREPYVQHERRF